MLNVDLVNTKYADRQFLIKLAGENIDHSQQRNSGFGIGPVNLTKGPLAAYRKLAALANTDPTSPETPSERSNNF